MQDWQPGQRYETGQQLKFGNQQFVVQQPHTSQGDWTPDRTPALFGRMQAGSHGQSQGQEQQQQQGRKERRGSDSSSDEEEFDKLSEEKKKEKQKFYETDKFKLGAQIAGGTVALGGLAGLGIWAYNKHAEKEKKEAWLESNVTEEKFYSGAKARTDTYYGARGEQVPVVRWVLVEEGGRLPEGAIQIGQEKDGKPLYAARAFHDGCASIGKTWADEKRANIPHKEKEVVKKKYEVLVGQQSSVKWVRHQTGQPCAPEGFRPVEGGRDDQGNFLFVARAPCDGGLHPAEVTENRRDAEIPYAGKVVHVEEFELLAYADQGRFGF